tara:strand:- start:522 stop:881 length:360 start_codon:yes stop_codon:yes gene_type:complete
MSAKEMVIDGVTYIKKSAAKPKAVSHGLKIGDFIQVQRVAQTETRGPRPGQMGLVVSQNARQVYVNFGTTTWVFSKLGDKTLTINPAISLLTKISRDATIPRQSDTYIRDGILLDNPKA